MSLVNAATSSVFVHCISVKSDTYARYRTQIWLKINKENRGCSGLLPVASSEVQIGPGRVLAKHPHWLGIKVHSVRHQGDQGLFNSPTYPLLFCILMLVFLLNKLVQARLVVQVPIHLGFVSQASGRTTRLAYRASTRRCRAPAASSLDHLLNRAKRRECLIYFCLHFPLWSSLFVARTVFVTVLLLNLAEACSRSVFTTYKLYLYF